MELESRLVEVSVPWAWSWEVRVSLVEDDGSGNSAGEWNNEAETSHEGAEETVDEHSPEGDFWRGDVGEVALEDHVDCESSKHHNSSRHVNRDDSSLLDIGNQEKTKSWEVSEPFGNRVPAQWVSHISIEEDWTHLAVSDKD